MQAVACSKPPVLETCSDSTWYFISFDAEYLRYKGACHDSQTDALDTPLPFLTDSVSLVGKYSWAPLQLLNVDHGFLKVDAKYWQQNSGYVTAHKFLKNPNTANDTWEHALDLLTAFNTGKVSRTRKQQEYLRSIVSMLWHTIYETVTSCERVTK